MKHVIRLSRRPIQVLLAPGTPSKLLTQFMRELQPEVAKGTYYRYSSALEKYLQFLEEESQVSEWHETEACRNNFYRFIAKKSQSQISSRQKNGQSYFIIKTSIKDQIDIIGTTSVLKKYYYWLISNKKASIKSNPFLIDSPLINERIDGKESAKFWLFGNQDKSPKREHENFFQIINKEWIPRANLPSNEGHKVLEAGLELGWDKRGESIARIIIEAAPRVSEACSLTIGDWFDSSCFGDSALSKDKGSNQTRRKTLIWSKGTTKLLHRYFNKERKPTNQNLRSINDYRQHLIRNKKSTARLEPIFSTNRNTNISADQFRKQYWNKAAKHCGSSMTPHQARHIFVCLALNGIESDMQSNSMTHTLKRSLINYMAWKSKEQPLVHYDTRPSSPGIQKILSLVNNQTSSNQNNKEIKSHNESGDEAQRRNDFDWITKGE
ncbi:MAG: hypothetical protein ABJQ78_09015 [Alloalcanivorax sp.]